MIRAVDLFAGFGGMTLAAKRAGVAPILAANHSTMAVEAHAMNHPGMVHLCQDLNQADWFALPDYELLLAGPSCPGYSPAANEGRKRSATVRRRHDAMRATAWAVADCLEATRPRAFIVENIPQFENWSSHPGDPARRGNMFRQWVATIELLGYRVQVGTLVASVHADVPQRRARLFVVGFLGRRKRAESRVLVDVPTSPEPAFGPCIDWGAGEWTDIDDGSDGVRLRVRRSREALGGARRFLTQHTRDHMGVSLDEPIRTITTKDQWAIVDGNRYRPLSIVENLRAQDLPEDLKWPDDANRGDILRGIGNAVPVGLGQVVVERTAAAM